MPDIFKLIANWWKHMLALVIVSTLVVGVITFLKPRQYLSVATAVPASSYISDKSKIFNQNIQGLYSALGTTDDLDIILGTAKLDTVYLYVTDEFNLFDHYKVKEKGDAARVKAAALLKKNTRVVKSEYGELKIKVWDTDKNLAPQLANAIFSKLESMHRELQSAGNQSTLVALDSAIKKAITKNDSLSFGDNQNEQINQYKKLMSEYQLLVDNKPPVLLMVEKAKPAEWPAKPKRLQVVISTFVLSLVFSLLVALLLEKRKQFSNG